MFEVLYFLGLVVVVVAVDEPIVNLRCWCPQLATGNPSLVLTADVPAYGQARCRNGEKVLVATDQVNYKLTASLNQNYKGGNCQFYKKAGSNTYTVDVEVGWGEPSSQVIQQRRIKTISCAYDSHGRAVSSQETISDWFLNPRENQNLLGGNSSATFDLQIWDVLDKRISGPIAIGRKIRLVAFDTSNSIPGLRTLSCLVRNANSRYYIVRAGCGDGLVFAKTSGFETIGNCVYSPYFDAFKLNGGDTVEFECVLTSCTKECNGNSCPTEGKAGGKSKRSVLAPSKYLVARSGPMELE